LNLEGIDVFGGILMAQTLSITRNQLIGGMRKDSFDGVNDFIVESAFRRFVIHHESAVFWS
jgi:Mg2+/Co2+ transporter CorC